MAEKIRLAFIGTNGHAYYVWDELDKCPNVECVAVAAESKYDDIKQFKTFSPHLKDAEPYDDWHLMLAKENLDIVVVCARYALNGQVCIEAIENGCNIVTEKPVASSLEQLEQLRAVLRANNRKLTTMYGMRCEPVFQTIKQAIDNGFIGEPLLISAQKSYKFGQRPEWFGDINQYGGTILWVAVHAIDFVRYTAGVEYSWVHAFSARKNRPEFAELDTCGSLHFGLTNGGSAIISYDYFRPAAASTHGDDGLRVVGSEGVIKTTDFGTKVELVTNNKKEHQLPLVTKAEFFTGFVHSLDGKGEAIVSEEDAFKVTEVCLKARQSAESGEVIKL